MNYLNITPEELERKGGTDTATEIESQPLRWIETFKKFMAAKDRIQEFLKPVMENDTTCVILTGAGSSAFVGEALEGSFQRRWRGVSRAVSTTKIITHPENYFPKSGPTLLISFARSGNSPESVAAVNLAALHCKELYQLNITCNKDGELAVRSNGKNALVFLLPEETNDRSLAMTSSFSSMLLAGLLVSNIGDLSGMEEIVRKVAGYGQHILSECLDTLADIAATSCERMVFLGSGPLFGIAHESHLKVQELTGGQIICKYDTFLGFRHGPKAVVNSSTIIVYLLSPAKYPRLYELDLVRSVLQTGAGEKSVAIGQGNGVTGIPFDFSLEMPELSVPEDFLPVFYVLPAQIIGFYKSMKLGLSPDSPSKNGAISRVVEGVTIYPYTT